MYRDLSSLPVHAKLAIALHCFERFVSRHHLEHHLISLFLDDMWDLPTIKGPDDFKRWESDHSDLVWVGLGGDFPMQFEQHLQSCGIEPGTFYELLENVVEIVFSNLYAMVDNEETTRHLVNVLNVVRTHGIEPPSLEHFQHSHGSVLNDWGRPLSSIQRDSWRYLPKPP